MQREAIADSADCKLEIFQRVNNKKQQMVVALRPRTKVNVATTAIISSSHPACNAIESGISSDGRTRRRAKLVAG
jgi:Tfp pilus assembly major pilin PilA